uniref:Lon N-terminal domain-containing protein n=2 Tax=Corethron hystrix TaxID=216773 RepID=A0A7S1G103_9STRA|mmetsp:Transcript_8609/g.18943  ORF Transcript_8609/g.18943 Transcript_8609/m.18943 type:complete len:362 (+) Transcript_8609:172-1257(+)
MIILFLFITFILLLANDPLRPTQYFVDSFSFVPSITYRQRALPCTFRRSTTVRSSSFSLTGYEPNPLYDENPPLANGIDSVKWMEPCDVTARRESAKEFLGQSGGASISPLDSYSKSEIIPLFPLSGMVYTPYTSHVLNIFEPRYRAMYSDILLNGTRRFVVTMSHPEKPGCFASTGVIFYLKDLKEVSQQTEDQIKYICEHEVIGRVEMTKVLNPAVWGTRDTYLKVEGKILEEDSLPLSASSLSEKEKEEITQSGADTQNVFMVGSMEEEASLRRSFAFLVDLQHELNEDVRFTRKSVPTLGVGPGGEKGSLWSTVRLWQSYTEQRLVGRQNELQLDFQEKLVKFLTEDKDVKEDELPR